MFCFSSQSCRYVSARQTRAALSIFGSEPDSKAKLTLGQKNLSVALSLSPSFHSSPSLVSTQCYVSKWPWEWPSTAYRRVMEERPILDNNLDFAIDAALGNEILWISSVTKTWHQLTTRQIPTLSPTPNSRMTRLSSSFSTTPFPSLLTT